VAGRRETNDLKPTDKVTIRVISESPGRNQSEREKASTLKTRRPSRLTDGEGSMGRRKLAAGAHHSGGVDCDGTVTRTYGATGEALLAPGENLGKR